MNTFLLSSGSKIQHLSSANAVMRHNTFREFLNVVSNQLSRLRALLMTHVTNTGDRPTATEVSATQSWNAQTPTCFKLYGSVREVILLHRWNDRAPMDCKVSGNVTRTSPFPTHFPIINNPNPNNRKHKLTIMRKYLQNKRLECTLVERPTRFILTCWKCYHDKSVCTRSALKWQIETNLMYFPQEDDDSRGIFCCYDCHKWMGKHARRMGCRQFGYMYTRGDYVKDQRITWDESDEMTKGFVIAVCAFEEEEEKRKAKKRSDKKSRKRKRSEPAAQQLAPAQVAPAPAPVPPAPPIPSVQSQNATATTVSTIPEPPSDRSSTGRSVLVQVSDHADNMRRIIRSL